MESFYRATAYRAFQALRYRVPRLFKWVLPRTASFQRGTTAYRVFSAGHYRVPRLYAVALPRYRASPQYPRPVSGTTAYRVLSAYSELRLFSLALPRTASSQLGTAAYRVFSAGYYRVPRLFSRALPRTATLCGSSTALPGRRGSTTAGALGHAYFCTFFFGDPEPSRSQAFHGPQPANHLSLPRRQAAQGSIQGFQRSGAQASLSSLSLSPSFPYSLPGLVRYHFVPCNAVPRAREHGSTGGCFIDFFKTKKIKHGKPARRGPWAHGPKGPNGG